MTTQAKTDSPFNSQCRARTVGRTPRYTFDPGVTRLSHRSRFNFNAFNPFFFSHLSDLSKVSVFVIFKHDGIIGGGLTEVVR